jgi:hypothetical protein
VAVAGKLLEYKLPEDAFKTQTAPYEVCTVWSLNFYFSEFPTF